MVLFGFLNCIEVGVFGLSHFEGGCSTLPEGTVD